MTTTSNPVEELATYMGQRMNGIISEALEDGKTEEEAYEYAMGWFRQAAEHFAAKGV